MAKINLAESIQRYSKVNTATKRLGNKQLGFLALLAGFGLLLPHQFSAVAAYVLIRSAALAGDKLGAYKVNQAIKADNDPAVLNEELAKLPIEVAARLAKKSKLVKENLSDEMTTRLAVHEFKRASRHFLSIRASEELMAIAAVSLSFPVNEIVRTNGADEPMIAGAVALGLLVIISLPTYIMKGINHVRQNKAAQAALQSLPNQALVTQEAESQQVTIE